MLEAMRPKQWTKNGLVFAAFLFALGDRQQDTVLGLQQFIISVEAALIFCLVSSGIYLVNDIRDRELDSAHPEKKNRPIASGRLQPFPAALAALLLLAGGITAAWAISPALAGVIGAYIGLQLAYCFMLKQVALVDVFVIAIGFVLRALAGGVAIKVAISPWLLLCTLFLALFLALCKRRHEKVVDQTGSATRQNIGDYQELLLNQLIVMMAGATIVSYSLYTLWPETVEKFGSHHLVYTVPFVIFGIFRYLDLVYRHNVGGKPEHILLTDPPLLIDIVLYGAVASAILLGFGG